MTKARMIQMPDGDLKYTRKPGEYITCAICQYQYNESDDTTCMACDQPLIGTNRKIFWWK